MSIVKTINNYEFWDWIKEAKSDGSNYGNCFTFEGANALQAYLEEYSEDTKSGVIEFDPIAWCVEFTEYKDFDTFQNDTGYTSDGINHVGYEDIKTLEDLKDNTTVIEFDGGIIIQDF